MHGLFELRCGLVSDISVHIDGEHWLHCMPDMPRRSELYKWRMYGNYRHDMHGMLDLRRWQVSNISLHIDSEHRMHGMLELSACGYVLSWLV